MFNCPSRRIRFEIEQEKSIVNRLNGRVAVVTGGASGIGRAATLRLLSEGARVVFADLNEHTAEETVALAAAAGHEEQVRFVKADVTSEESVAAVMALAVKVWKRLDVAFLNAGVGGAFGPIADTRVADWDATFAYLVRSVFLGIKHAAGQMRHGSGGSIIATASASGITAGGGSHAYSAAKAAVLNLVRSTALELAQDRIRVNAIAPGLVATPLVHGGDESKLPDVSDRQPWPDHGRPEDIAGAVVYLASDESTFMTGSVVVIDGGLLANGANPWRTKGPYLRKAGMNRGTTGFDSEVHAVSEPNRNT